MQWRITIVSSLTSTSLTRSHTIRCRSRMSRVSAAERRRVRNAERVAARRRCAARSRVCSNSAFQLVSYRLFALTQQRHPLAQLLERYQALLVRSEQALDGLPDAREIKS